MNFNKETGTASNCTVLSVVGDRKKTQRKTQIGQVLLIRTNHALSSTKTSMKEASVLTQMEKHDTMS